MKQRYILGIYEYDKSGFYTNFSIHEIDKIICSDIAQHAFFIYNITTKELIKNKSYDNIDTQYFRDIISLIIS